ncbi:MAG: anaerobic ribonucleoside-triphosphate reductase activating protein [Promicromonosporaceae bacterium]|nr:anaerobic ribonucleoside-triphosphate reductase activating protein [Promicromonosporaceae bacterium]
MDRTLPRNERDRLTEAVAQSAASDKQQPRKPNIDKWAQLVGWDNFSSLDQEDLTKNVSQNYIADYKPFSMVDGEGTRCSLYVSGCLFACPGCFNEVAWSFRYGQPYSDELENRILTDLAQPFVQGLSLLGGEPFQNPRTCLRLVERVRLELPNKDIWAWTGYTLEQLFEIGSWSQIRLLEQVDVLVDGPFMHEQKNLSLAYRGSENQRLIDVPASLKRRAQARNAHRRFVHKPILWAPDFGRYSREWVANLCIDSGEDTSLLARITHEDSLRNGLAYFNQHRLPNMTTTVISGWYMRRSRELAESKKTTAKNELATLRLLLDAAASEGLIDRPLDWESAGLASPLVK